MNNIFIRTFVSLCLLLLSSSSIFSADLSISIGVNNSAPGFGSEVEFTITASNVDVTDATGVSVTATLPDGYTYISHTGGASYNLGILTWSIGNLTSTSSSDMTITATVNTSGTYGFTGSITSDQVDPNLGNNTSTNTPVPIVINDLALTMGVSNATPDVGSNVTFTLTATNSGPSDATGVTVTAGLPDGYTYVSDNGSGAYTPGTGIWAAGAITAAANKALEITAAVNPTGTYTFPGTITGGQNDPTAGNNTTSTTTTPTPITDLALTMGVSNATPDMGSNVTFTITATNNGPSNATGVTVTAGLPDGYTYVSDNGSGAYTPGTGIWAAGAITAAASKALEITAAVNPTGTYTFPGTITGGQNDPTAGNNTTSTTTTPTPITDLALTMGVSNATPDVGSNVTFTITATNNGPSNATGVTVTAGLPDGYTYVSDNGSGAYTPGTGIWAAGAITAAASKALEITAAVNPTGTYTFPGTITGGQNDPTAGNNTASATTTPTPITDLALTMGVSNATPDVGSNVTFTITATNNGPSGATGVAVTAALPNGYSLVSHTGGASYTPGTGTWTVGALASSASDAMTITATVNPAGTYSFSGSVTGVQSDPDLVNNSTSSTTTPTPITDLALTMAVSNATPDVGSNVVFTITATNNGPSGATGVTVTAGLPDGYTYVSDNGSGAYTPGTGIWAAGAITAAASKALEITAAVNPTGTYTFPGTITGGQNDPTAGNNTTSTTTTPTPITDLALTMGVSNATPDVGSNVVFTITATNNGPSGATGVAVTAALPNGYSLVSHTGGASYTPGTGTWTVGALASSASDAMTITATVNPAGTYSFSGSVTGVQSDPDLVNNSTSTTTTPTPITDLALTMGVSNATPDVGSNVTFTITATNNGPSGATGVAVTAALPNGYSLVSHTGGASYTPGTGTWTVGALASSASDAMTITATVNPAGTYSFSGSVTGVQSDPDLVNNSTSSTTTPTPITDLALTMAVSNATPDVGSNVVFTITATNNGPSGATGVTVTAGLPDGYTYVSDNGSGAYTPGTGIWAAGAITAAASKALEITAAVNPTGTYTFPGTITGGQNDPTAGNNTASATTTPTPITDLALTMGVSNATPDVGSNVVFTITATNNGPSGATGVAVTAALPNGYSLVSHTGGASYTPGTGTWTVGALASSASDAMTITATVNPAGTYSFSGSVTGVQSDPDLVNNSTSSTTTPTPITDLALTMAVSNATPDVGSNVVFTITATNNGPSSASGVSVTGGLPDGYTYVSDNGGGDYTPGTGPWAVGAITASTSKTLEITATVKPTGTYTFPGSITGGQSDPTAGNNTTSTTTTPTPITDLTLGVAVDEEEPDVGSNVTFTITATNNGPSNATGVNVSAILPAGYTLISQTGGTNYIPGTGAWSVGDLAASTNKTLEITASVNPSGPYAFNGTIAGSQTDLITDNNDASTTTTPQPITDLALNMAVDNPTPDVGSNVTFSLTATNNGPSNATGVTVTAALPAGYTYVSHTAGMTYSSGSWTVGNLAAGTNKTLEITATVNPTGSYTFNGTIEGGQTDLTTGNNSTSTTTNSTDITDLVIDVTVDNATPNVGSHVVFTLTATNNGPSDASGVNVTAALPAGYTYVSHTSGIAYISGTWTVGNLTAGTSKELKITATVNPPANYLFNASISGNQSDLSTGNNSDQISITPQQSDLIINMSASESDPLVGETVTFTLSATNEGPNNATNVLVTDQLPSGFTHTGSTPSKGSYNASSGIWTIGALAVNETVTLQISSSVKAPETGNNYLNKASITGDQYDPDTSNNEAKVLADPQQSDLSIIVTADQSDYYVDNQPVFTITIDNEGPDEASGLAINAVVPAGYSDISDISSGGVLSSGTISWSNKNLNNGASLSLTFKATIDPPQQAANEYQVAAFIAAFDQFDPVESDNSASLTPNILNTPPVANANDATTDEDTPLNVNAANGVLSNDTDIDGDPLTVTQFRVNSMTRPAGTELTFTQGKLTIHPNGSFTYTPALNFNGAVPEISYTVSDGTTTSTGILGITVNAVNDSPVVTDDYVYTAEGTPVNYSILANDNDLADGSAGGLDGNTLKITQEPSNGTLTILQNNQIIYSPHTGFYGNDEAEYEICDLGYPGSLCRSAKIFFSVARRSPIANDDTAETDEDEAVQIDILSNDDDTDIDPTTVEIIVKPKYGTANYLGNGMVEYMPDQDFNGTDFFTYTVTDRTNLTSNEARVDITIHPVDDAPVATDGLYSTRENQPVVIPMSERVSDADNNIDWNSIAIVAQPANGQVTTGPGTGEVSYTPDNHFFGTDEFQFTLSDLTSLTSNVATISIQVSDQAPTAADDVASTNEDEAVIIHVLDNDTDPQNDINTASVAISQAPQNGSASPNEDGTVTYTPNPDYFGEDSFFYKVCDDIDYCDEARVTITIDPVNDAPVAVDDEVTLPEDTSVLIRALNNDFDVDNANGELTLTIVTQPLNGAAQLVSEPIGIQYTPNENYFGTDQIIYRITDPDGLWDEATINLSITWVNDTPLSANDQYGPISLAGATLDVLANDSDPDDNLDPSSLSIYEAPKNGTATPNPDGTIYYLPNEDFFGNDSFLYQICDEEGACAQAQVSLSVIAGNGPPQANNDEYTLSEDEPYLFNPIGNDQDPNNNIDPSTLQIIQAPENGTLEFMGDDGSMQYTPAADFYGSDSFVYEICDTGDPVYCDQATVSFTITPANDAPRPLPDFFNTYDMTTVTIQVLNNDAEPEGEAMSASLTTQSPSTFGEFFMNEAGEFTYEAYPGSYCQTDTVYYQVCDPHNACAESFIVIEISPLDTDGDGIPDYQEKDLNLYNGDPLDHHTMTDWPDTDGDGTPDYLSTDSDGDGIPDEVESGIIDPCEDLPRDTDGDGIPDYRDPDSDGDGVPDAEEGTGDCDNDGIPNYLDPFDDCADRLNVPSTFSPNGDGVNDYWVIQGVSDFPDNELSIFNRWGNLVYQKSPYDNSWDGRASSSVFGSDELPEGTYFYILKMNEEVYKGSVYIKK